MATNYKTPGVYIEEISLLPASVAPVATAIPAFIGRTKKAVNAKGEGITGKPFRITSMPEYERFFGGGENESKVFAVSIKDVKADTTSPIERTITVTEDKTKVSGKYMYYAMQMYFANGGGPCYIVSLSTAGNALTDAITELEKQDEPTMILFTDKPTGTYKDAYDNALIQAAKLGDRVVLMDIWEETGNAYDDAFMFRNQHVSAANLKYGMAYYPFLKSSLPYVIDETGLSSSDKLKVAHTLKVGNAVAAASTYNNKTLDEIETQDPNLYRLIEAKLQEKTIDVPPSPAMAGIYARVDAARGVWKAPANEAVLSVIGPTIKVTAEDQEDLNVDATSGKSINVIRTFTGKGTLVWGARTLAGNDNEWRYINVRRFYNFAEESIKKATEFVVFEPNDANTWVKMKTMVENFLTTLWRQGALQGAKPADAFFVNVGIGVTMTALDILEGRMNVEIGMAVVRPAEFIILKFSHLLQKS